MLHSVQDRNGHQDDASHDGRHPPPYITASRSDADSPSFSSDCRLETLVPKEVPKEVLEVLETGKRRLMMPLGILVPKEVLKMLETGRRWPMASSVSVVEMLVTSPETLVMAALSPGSETLRRRRPLRWCCWRSRYGGGGSGLFFSVLADSALETAVFIRGEAAAAAAELEAGLREAMTAVTNSSDVIGRAGSMLTVCRQHGR